MSRFAWLVMPAVLAVGCTAPWGWLGGGNPRPQGGFEVGELSAKVQAAHPGKVVLVSFWFSA